MMFVRRFVCLIILFSAYPMFAESSLASGVLGKTAIFPEVHSQADIRRMYNQKNEYSKRHHFIEATLYVEPVWLSFDSLIFMATAFDVNLGMGRTPKDVVFDPMDANFAFTPFFEARFKPLTARAGLDHRCFHEIDQKELPTVYWNMLFLSAHSPSMRLTDFARSVYNRPISLWRDRVAWSFKAGIFMKNFFDIVRKSSVNYENDRKMEFELKGRTLAWQYKEWAFAAEGQIVAGGHEVAEEKSNFYWSQMLSLQALYRLQTNKIVYLFVRGTLDDMPPHRMQPRFSKSKLIEFGVGVGL